VSPRAVSISTGAQPAQQRQAVLAGQHQVQHDDVGLGRRHRLPHGPAVRRQGDLPAETFEIGLEAGADLGVVIDDEAMSIHTEMPTFSLAT